MEYASIIEKLLSSKELSIRWRTRVNVLGESRESLDIISLENEIKNSIIPYIGIMIYLVP